MMKDAVKEAASRPTRLDTSALRYAPTYASALGNATAAAAAEAAAAVTMSGGRARRGGAARRGGGWRMRPL